MPCPANPNPNPISAADNVLVYQSLAINSPAGTIVQHCYNSPCGNGDEIIELSDILFPPGTLVGPEYSMPILADGCCQPATPPPCGTIPVPCLSVKLPTKLFVYINAAGQPPGDPGNCTCLNGTYEVNFNGSPTQPVWLSRLGTSGCHSLPNSGVKVSCLNGFLTVTPFCNAFEAFNIPLVDVVIGADGCFQQASGTTLVASVTSCCSADVVSAVVFTQNLTGSECIGYFRDLLIPASGIQQPLDKSFCSSQLNSCCPNGSGSLECCANGTPENVDGTPVQTLNFHFLPLLDYGMYKPAGFTIDPLTGFAAYCGSTCLSSDWCIVRDCGNTCSFMRDLYTHCQPPYSIWDGVSGMSIPVAYQTISDCSILTGQTVPLDLVQGLLPHSIYFSRGNTSCNDPSSEAYDGLGSIHPRVRLWHGFASGIEMVFETVVSLEPCARIPGTNALQYWQLRVVFLLWQVTGKDVNCNLHLLGSDVAQFCGDAGDGSSYHPFFNWNWKSVVQFNLGNTPPWCCATVFADDPCNLPQPFHLWMGTCCLYPTGPLPDCNISYAINLRSFDSTCPHTGGTLGGHDDGHGFRIGAQPQAVYMANADIFNTIGQAALSAMCPSPAFEIFNPNNLNLPRTVPVYPSSPFKCGQILGFRAEVTL